MACGAFGVSSLLPQNLIDIKGFAGNYVPVKLRGKEETVLDILRQEELYGLDIVKRSHGALGRGTVYVHLSRMEDRGLVEAKTVPSERPDGLPRRLYKATELGWNAFLMRHATLLPEAYVV